MVWTRQEWTCACSVCGYDCIKHQCCSDYSKNCASSIRLMSGGLCGICCGFWRVLCGVIRVWGIHVCFCRWNVDWLSSDYLMLDGCSCNGNETWWPCLAFFCDRTCYYCSDPYNFCMNRYTECTALCASLMPPPKPVTKEKEPIQEEPLPNNMEDLAKGLRDGVLALRDGIVEYAV
jgi:hypothetical protein